MVPTREAPPGKALVVDALCPAENRVVPIYIPCRSIAVAKAMFPVTHLMMSWAGYKLLSHRPYGLHEYQGHGTLGHGPNRPR